MHYIREFVYGCKKWFRCILWFWNCWWVFRPLLNNPWEYGSDDNWPRKPNSYDRDVDELKKLKKAKTPVSEETTTSLLDVSNMFATW